jgi:hypothetical protein
MAAGSWSSQGLFFYSVGSPAAVELQLGNPCLPFFGSRRLRPIVNPKDALLTIFLLENSSEYLS